MRIEDLSVNERILIHLKDFSMDPESQGATLGQTQEGIGEAVGIRINHVPRATKTLLEDGYVDEALVHIGGLKRKRKAFFLTGKGAEIAGELISNLREQKVKFVNRDGEPSDMTIQDMLFGAGGATPSRLILTYFREGLVLQSAMAGEDNKTYITNLDTVPMPENFTNRTWELERLDGHLNSGKNLTVVSGIKGIGKTSLVRVALEKYQGKKNIFWYSAHEWDTARNVLERISEYLVSLSRKELKKVLRLSRDVDVGQAADAFFRDCRDADCIIVIDNIFDMKREVMHFISLTCEQSHKMGNSSLLLITRDRESLGGITCLHTMGDSDIALKGLERESAMKLMDSMGMEPEDSDRVFAMTQGHPLAISLVNSQEIKKQIDIKGLTKEEVWVVRCMKAFEAILNE